MKRLFESLALAVLMLALAALPCFATGTQETKTLTLWTGFAERVPVFTSAADDFMAENPNVKIEISSFKAREAEQKYAISLPAGTAPDLYDPDHMLIPNYAAEGGLEPVPDEYLTWVNENWQKVYVNTSEHEGKIYGIPGIHGFQVLYYNLDHYAEAGLSKPPVTLDELMSHARKLVKKDRAGNMVRSGVSLRLSGGGAGVAQKFDAFLFANGGAVIEDAGGGKWKPNFNNEAGYTALNFYLQALHKHEVDGYNVKHDAEAFVLGVTSQFNRETYVIGMAKQRAPQMKYGITQVVGGSERATNLIVDPWIVPASSRNKDLAWKFARYMQQDKYCVQMMRDVGWVPTKSNVDYSEVYAQQPHFKQALDRPQGFELIPNSTALSAEEAYTKFSSALVEVLSDASLVDNRARIMKFLADAEKTVVDVLKSNNEYAE